jgi:branched-chain amino acid transport system substrate-binding protein
MTGALSGSRLIGHRVQARAARATPSRRELLIGTAAIGCAAAMDGIARPAIAQSGPIKIGVLTPVSGPMSSLGNHKLNGIKMLFEKNGMKIGDRPVSLIVEDDEFKPQEALRKARKLVESDQVDVLLGVLSSAVGYAMKEYVARAQKVWVTTGAAADGIFKKKNNNPYAFRSSLSVWQANQPMGTWLAEKGFKRVLLTGPDYAMGKEAVEAFRSTFQVKGAEKVGEVFVPIGTTDFASYLPRIKQAQPDLVYASYAGADAVRFVQQFAGFGLGSSIKLSGYGYLVEEDLFAAQGDAAVGIQSGMNWAYGLDTPENKDFIAEYRKRYNDTATVDAVAGYIGAQVVSEAIKSLGGNVRDQLALSKAVAAVKLASTPRGPISFDPETNNVIQNIFIREVRKEGNEIHNYVLAKYENVRDPGE